MHDEIPVFAHRAGGMLRGTLRALPVDYVMAADTLVSLHRLQSAFLEPSTALNETLRDERTNVAACLQRAQAMLRSINYASREL